MPKKNKIENAYKEIKPIDTSINTKENYPNIRRCSKGYFTIKDENICTRRYFKTRKLAIEEIFRQDNAV